MPADPELALRRETAPDPSGLYGAFNEFGLLYISSVSFLRVGGSDTLK